MGSAIIRLRPPNRSSTGEELAEILSIWTARRTNDHTNDIHGPWMNAGHVRVVLGDQDWVLGPGDVAEFDSRLRRWFFSTAAEFAELLTIFGRRGERMAVRAT